LCAIAEPRIGAVLNVGYTHASKLGSIEAIAAEKLTLVDALPPDGTALLNADDPRVAPAAGRLACRVVTFGTAPEATLRASAIRDRGLAGTTFTATYDGATAEVASPLPGVHTIPAALTAIGIALAAGMPLGDAAEAVRSSAGSGRLRAIPGANGATL